MTTPQRYLGNDNFGVHKPLFVGNNFNTKELAAFANAAKQQNIKLNDEERALLEIFKAKGLIAEDKEGVYHEVINASIISHHKALVDLGKDIVRKHELGHVMYEQDPVYHAAVAHLWQTLDPALKQAMELILHNIGYDVAVYETEFAEYVADPVLLKSHLVSIFEAAVISDPFHERTMDERKRAFEIYQKIFEHRKSTSNKPGGDYLTKPIALALTKASQEAIRKKNEAFARAGVVDRMDQLPDGFYDGPNSSIHDDQGPLMISTYTSIQVFSGPYDQVLQSVKGNKELTPKQQSQLRPALDRFIKTNGYDPRDIFEAFYEGKGGWKISFVRKYDQISMQDAVGSMTKQIPDGQKADISLYFSALGKALDTRTWGIREGATSQTTVNLDGEKFSLAVDFTYIESTIGVETHGEWEARIKVFKPGQENSYSNIFSSGKGNTIKGAFDRSVTDFRDRLDREGIGLSSKTQAQDHVTMQQVLRQWEKALSRPELQYFYEANRQIIFNGQVVDLHLMSTQKESFGERTFETHLGIENIGDGFHQEVRDGLGVVVGGSPSRLEGLREAVKQLNRKMADKAMKSGMLGKLEAAIRVALFPLIAATLSACVSTAQNLPRPIPQTVQQQSIAQNTPPFPSRTVQPQTNPNYTLEEKKQIKLFIAAFKNGRVNFALHMTGKDKANQYHFGDGFINFYDQLRYLANERLTTTGRITAQEVATIADEVLTQDVNVSPYQQQGLEMFFKGIWSEYLIALANNQRNIQEIVQDLIYQAGQYSQDLANMVRQMATMIGTMSKSDVDRFSKDFQKFNESYLIPNEYYAEINIMKNIREGRAYYLAVVYKIEKTEQRKVNGTNVSTIYGRKIDSVNTKSFSAHSIKGKRIVFIDLKDVDSVVDKITQTLKGDPFILIAQGRQVHVPVVTARVRTMFSGMTEDQIREQILHSTRGHEFFHQVQDMLGHAYKGQDHFGFPVDVWNSMPPEMQTENQKLLNRETGAMLAEFITAKDPRSELFEMFAKILSGENSPYYFGARWILNRLDDRPMDQWTGWQSPDALLEQFNRLWEKGPALRGEVEGLMEENWSPETVEAVKKADSAMSASLNQRAMKVLVNKKADVGGIDFTEANQYLQTKDSGQPINFHVDPAQLAQLQNAPGFAPVIIDIQPLSDLRSFLGIV